MKRDENQNVEYKESWYDKYIEWICGYANDRAAPRRPGHTAEMFPRTL